MATAAARNQETTALMRPKGRPRNDGLPPGTLPTLVFISPETGEIVPRPRGRPSNFFLNAHRQIEVPPGADPETYVRGLLDSEKAPTKEKKALKPAAPAAIARPAPAPAAPVPTPAPVAVQAAPKPEKKLFGATRRKPRPRRRRRHPQFGPSPRRNSRHPRKPFPRRRPSRRHPRRSRQPLRRPSEVQPPRVPPT